MPADSRVNPRSRGVPKIIPESSLDIRNGYYDGQVIQDGDLFYQVKFGDTSSGQEYTFIPLSENDAAKAAFENNKNLSGKYDVIQDMSGPVPMITIRGAGKNPDYIKTTKETSEPVDPAKYTPSVDTSSLSVSPMRTNSNTASSSNVKYQSGTGMSSQAEEETRQRILNSMKKRMESVPEYNYNMNPQPIPESRNIFKKKNTPESAAIARALQK